MTQKYIFSGSLNVSMHAVIELKSTTQAHIPKMLCIESVTEAESEVNCNGLSFFNLIFSCSFSAIKDEIMPETNDEIQREK